MVIEVVGPGCQNCKKLLQNTHIALDRLQLKAEVQYVVDIEAIANSGILRTPGLIINGKILSQGKVLAPIEIQALVQAAL